MHVSILKPIGDENSEHCPWFLLCLKVEYAVQYSYSSTSLIHLPILKPVHGECLEHCLCFLLLSKSSMPFSFRRPKTTSLSPDLFVTLFENNGISDASRVLRKPKQRSSCVQIAFESWTHTSRRNSPFEPK